MKMRTTFFIIAVISLMLGALTILPITQSSLDWSVERLTGSQKENMRQVLAGSFEDKRIYLSNLSNVIQSDANLAGALVLADASRDYAMFNELLEDLRQKSNLQYFEVMPLNQVHSKTAAINACLIELNATLNGAALCQNGDQIMVALLSPIYLYGEKVGMMFLAANLVSSQPLRLDSGTQKNANEVYRLGTSAVVAELKPNIESIQAVTSTLRKVIILGALIALVFMLIFIGLAVRYFFLKPFHSILSDLDLAFTHIEQKKDFQFDEKKAFALENKKLIHALETFVAKIMNYEKQLTESNSRLVESEKNAAIGRLSRQVAHDIRSPLTALQLAIREMGQRPDSYHELLVSASERINNIANQLLKNYKTSVHSVSSETSKQESTLLDCLRVCVQEKALIAKERNIEIHILGNVNDGHCFVTLAATPLQNAISNIVTNAMEASAAGTQVRIQFSKRGSNAHIVVQDQGKGIPEDILSRIGKEEITFGKESGNGLGLFSANQVIRSCGGQLTVRSKVGAGTEVEIVLPLREAQPSAIESIRLIAGAEIVVIDDDKAVHEIWRHRLNDLAVFQTVLTSNILTVDLFADWFLKNGLNTDQKYHFFVDYDFHNPEFNGLDLIEKYRLSGRAILVTAHHSEPEVIARAKALNTPILPKPMLASIPFIVE